MASMYFTDTDGAFTITQNESGDVDYLLVNLGTDGAYFSLDLQTGTGHYQGGFISDNASTIGHGLGSELAFGNDTGSEPALFTGYMANLAFLSQGKAKVVFSAEATPGLKQFLRGLINDKSITILVVPAS